MGRQGIDARAGFARFLLTAFLVPQLRLAHSQLAVASYNVSEQYLKVAADQERAAVGLPALLLDSALSAAAHRHAVVMARNNSISHRYMDEPDPTSRAAAAGARFSLITENVAQAPSAMAMHSAWMQSKEHRHNLLDPNVNAVGISVVERDGQMFAVEDFAHSLAVLSVNQQEEVVARTLRAFGVAVESSGEEVRRVCTGGSSAEMRHPPEFETRYTTADLGRLPSQLVTQLHSGKNYRALIGACPMDRTGAFSLYRVAVLLYPMD